MDDPENDPNQPSGAAAVYTIMALVILVSATIGAVVGSIATLAIIRLFGL